jgi:hypothetical protein
MHTLLQALPDPMCHESTLPPPAPRVAPPSQCSQLHQSMQLSCTPAARPHHLLTHRWQCKDLMGSSSYRLTHSIPMMHHPRSAMVRTGLANSYLLPVLIRHILALHLWLTLMQKRPTYRQACWTLLLNTTPPPPPQTFTSCVHHSSPRHPRQCSPHHQTPPSMPPP